MRGKIALETDLKHEFMGKPKDLLKQQEISFDNHQPGKPAEWDDDLHFHKKMTVGGLRGSKVAGAGIGFGAAELTWWLSDLCFGKGSNVAVGSSGNTVDVAVRW